VTSAAGVSLPPEVALTFSTPPSEVGPDRIANATIRCPIRESKWTCVLPAVPLDIRFDARDAVPIYAWDVPMPLGAPRTYNLALRTGASIAGFVVDANGHQPSSPARVRLATPAGVPIDGRRKNGKSTYAFAVTTTPRGFFQIAPVPASAYRVIAEHKELGKGEAPITVTANKELVLDTPVTLDPPNTLTVHVLPVRDPAGKPWRVQLIQGSNQGLERSYPDRAVDDAGTLTIARLLPGRYELMVVGQTTVTSPVSAWGHRTLDIHQDDTVDLRVDALHLSGLVRLGDRPLHATVKVKVGFSQMVEVETDDTGAFDTVVPRPEDLAHDVRAEFHVVCQSPQVTRRVKKTFPPGAAEEHVDIVLPNGRISGTVVTADGAPVAGATVKAMTNDSWAGQSDTNQTGRFVLQGLPDGQYRVEASSPDAVSEAVVVNTSASSDPDVRILLHPLTKRRIRITSAEGPIPGAAAIFVPIDAPLGDRVGLATYAAAADGVITLDAPKGTRQLGFFAVTEGYPIRIGLVSLPHNDDVLDIPLGHDAGTLQISGLPDPLSLMADPDRPVPYIFHNGFWGRVSMFSSAPGAAREPTRLTLREVDPGPYSVCEMTMMHAGMLTGAQAPSPSCVSGVLMSGQTLTLHLTGREAAGSH